MVCAQIVPTLCPAQILLAQVGMVLIVSHCARYGTMVDRLAVLLGIGMLDFIGTIARTEIVALKQFSSEPS